MDTLQYIHCIDWYDVTAKVARNFVSKLDSHYQRLWTMSATEVAYVTAMHVLWPVFCCVLASVATRRLIAKRHRAETVRSVTRYLDLEARVLQEMQVDRQTNRRGPDDGTDACESNGPRCMDHTPCTLRTRNPLVP